MQCNELRCAAEGMPFLRYWSDTVNLYDLSANRLNNLYLRHQQLRSLTGGLPTRVNTPRRAAELAAAILRAIYSNDMYRNIRCCPDMEGYVLVLPGVQSDWLPMRKGDAYRHCLRAVAEQIRETKMERQTPPIYVPEGLQKMVNDFYQITVFYDLEAGSPVGDMYTTFYDLFDEILETHFSEVALC